jgi:hypothetical protein
MFRLYLLAGAAAVSLAVGGLVYFQYSKIQNLKEQATRLTFAVESCTARVDNIEEDSQSDNEVNRTPDDGLRDLIDPRWLRGETEDNSE